MYRIIKKAIENKNSAFLQRFFKALNFDVNLKDIAGNTLLMKAAQEGVLPIVELLIQNECSLDKQNNEGVSALMMAAENGHKEVADYLIRQGAELDFSDISGETALMKAIQNNHEEIVFSLLDAQADVNIENQFNQTPLIIASYQGQADLVKALLRQTNDINNQDDDGHQNAVAQQQVAHRCLKIFLLQSHCMYLLSRWPAS